MAPRIVEIRNLTKIQLQGEIDVTALHDVSLGYRERRSVGGSAANK